MKSKLTPGALILIALLLVLYFVLPSQEPAELPENTLPQPVPINRRDSGRVIL